MLEKLFDIFKKSSDNEIKGDFDSITPKSDFSTGNYLFSVSFDGEKSRGEIGVIKSYDIDFVNLRHRSWQFYLDNAVTHLIINRFVTWVIGNGLRLQSEPMKDILLENNINIDAEKFSQAVESRFKMFLKSTRSTYSNQKTLNSLSSDVVKNCYISGDCLVIQRYENNTPKIQLIDGIHVETPYDYKYIQEAESRGNRVFNGVEIDSKGGHVAYFVKTQKDTLTMTHERVIAKDLRGRKTAFLVYGKKYREDDHRGIPMITSIMETIKKLDRYTEATVGSAEERQKIAYQIIHNELSTGASPITTRIRSDVGKVSTTNNGFITTTPNEIAQTSEKSVFNMENGSELKQLSSDNELSFKEFFTTVLELICISVGISPEVAMSKFIGSYSSSRAAIKDWEHTLDILRESVATQFYQPIYEYWLDSNVFSDKIIADGYKKALINNDYDVLDSYRNARWVGASVPHIDPLKEVKAEREKLGILGAHLPLTTLEMATENVKGGDSVSNVSQFLKEIEKIKMPEPKQDAEVDKNNSESVTKNNKNKN